jgi:hypothetical protein
VLWLELEQEGRMMVAFGEKCAQLRAAVASAKQGVAKSDDWAWLTAQPGGQANRVFATGSHGCCLSARPR